jgi:hypothetical protein
VQAFEAIELLGAHPVLTDQTIRGKENLGRKKRGGAGTAVLWEDAHELKMLRVLQCENWVAGNADCLIEEAERRK